jgi:hypothetical protein
MGKRSSINIQYPAEIEGLNRHRRRFFYLTQLLVVDFAKLASQNGV